MWFSVALLLALVVVHSCGPVRAEIADDAIDPSSWSISFQEEFDGRLDVSSWGPGTRWIAHTPWNGDFGAQVFADPRPGFPFVLKDGQLRIEARRLGDGKWYSGLLASVDSSNVGFSQKYGYFEVRAKLPKGPGLWTAFWLMGVDSNAYSAEIDVFEHYGDRPGSFMSTVHEWNRADVAKSESFSGRVHVPSGSLYSVYNTFGVFIDEDWIKIYLNRKLVWRTPTPPSHRQPMYVLLNLALEPDFPLNRTPNPSYMWVDYVRVWKLPEH